LGDPANIRARIIGEAAQLLAARDALCMVLHNTNMNTRKAKRIKGLAL